MMIFGKLLRTSLVAFGALAVASVTQASAADVYTGGGYRDCSPSQRDAAGSQASMSAATWEWPGRRSSTEVASLTISIPAKYGIVKRNLGNL